MPIAIKSPTEIAAKFAKVTPGRTEEYRQGVTNPAEDWERNTLAAEDSYNSGVTASIRAGSFGKGVARAGTEKWKAGATGKGVERFGPGVAGAEQAYADGFAPYQQVIAGLNLPPRREKGNAANLDNAANVELLPQDSACKCKKDA